MTTARGRVVHRSWDLKPEVLDMEHNDTLYITLRATMTGFTELNEEFKEEFIVYLTDGRLSFHKVVEGEETPFTLIVPRSLLAHPVMRPVLDFLKTIEIKERDGKQIIDSVRAKYTAQRIGGTYE